MQKLSIIIPAYNEERFIREILERVKKADLKTLGIVKEIIVVDDGSTDKTAAIAAKVKGVNLMRQVKNSGQGAP